MVPMQPRRLAGQLKQKAYDLGFHAVGIASVESLEAAEHLLSKRILTGDSSGQDPAFEKSGRFAHPSQALPGAKSVVAVALSYLAKESPDERHVARFARGEDYHKVVSRRLQQLSAWLTDKVPDARTLICVDTGPVLDRPLAREAGVGCYGKNALIRVPGRGSWVVLGEMLTDVALQPDEPADFDDCVGCDVCLKACPTGSIVAPYIIDANRCISHLTQMKGFIPRELRSIIGETIYGCDICQESCPRNVGAEETDVPEFQAACRMERLPDLLEILSISADDFRKRIGGRTMAWIGRSRLRRNAAVALGNLRAVEAVPELVKMIGETEPILSAHSAWALGRIGTTVAVEALSSALSVEQDPRVIEEIESALAGR